MEVKKIEKQKKERRDVIQTERKKERKIYNFIATISERNRSKERMKERKNKRK